jgi:hypothetical protein
MWTFCGLLWGVRNTAEIGFNRLHPFQFMKNIGILLNPRHQGTQTAAIGSVCALTQLKTDGDVATTGIALPDPNIIDFLGPKHRSKAYQKLWFQPAIRTDRSAPYRRADIYCAG